MAPCCSLRKGSGSRWTVKNCRSAAAFILSTPVARVCDYTFVFQINPLFGLAYRTFSFRALKVRPRTIPPSVQDAYFTTMISLYNQSSCRHFKQSHKFLSFFSFLDIRHLLMLRCQSVFYIVTNIGPISEIPDECQANIPDRHPIFYQYLPQVLDKCLLQICGQNWMNVVTIGSGG